MPATKLNKWGNSQGVLIPKSLCEAAGFRVGDTVELSINPETRRIELATNPAVMIRGGHPGK